MRNETSDQHHFETTASRETAQTRTLIADLDRIVQILNSVIAAEEEQARIFDRFQAEYPMHARQLAARRDNLTDTIAAFEHRLRRQKMIANNAIWLTLMKC
jgi:hypothetical protein